MADIVKVSKPDINGHILANKGWVKKNDEKGEELPFKLGIDEEGNYGYYKVGADTLTPFKSGPSLDGAYTVTFKDDQGEDVAIYLTKEGQGNIYAPSGVEAYRWLSNGSVVHFPYTPTADIEVTADNSVLWSDRIYEKLGVNKSSYPYFMIYLDKSYKNLDIYFFNSKPSVSATTLSIYISTGTHLWSRIYSIAWSTAYDNDKDALNRFLSESWGTPGRASSGSTLTVTCPNPHEVLFYIFGVDSIGGWLNVDDVI